MALGTGLDITENLANNDFRAPDRPVPKESLSHLSSYQRATSDILINSGRFITFHNLNGMSLQTYSSVDALNMPD